MSDDDRLAGMAEKAQSFSNADHFAAARGHVAVRAYLAVAHPGQVIGDQVVIGRKKRGDEGEAARVREKTVGHQHRRRGRISPAEVMHPHAVNRDETFLAWNGQGLCEPVWQN